MSDEEYEDLLKAQKQTLEDKKKINYHIVAPPCCATCKNSSRMYVEDEYFCSVMSNSRWATNNVDDFGLCDKYVQAQPKGSI